MIRALPLLLALLFGYAHADEEVSICFNYGCSAEQVAVFSEARLSLVKARLASSISPEEERSALATVIGTLYRWAGEQTPVYADRGGNSADNGVRGGMDCIDHATTTTRFLRLLEQREWLRFHRVDEPARRTRFFVFDHFSAQIEELAPAWLPAEDDEQSHLPEAPVAAKPPHFVVDSWFVDNGKPAVVLPLDEWMDGGGPDVEPD